ncbi:MAG: hypothetical protein WEC84_02075 [Candidatus Andersenbacteria bacterium]
MSIKNLKVRVVAPLIVLILPVVVQAAIVPCGGPDQNPCKFSDLFQLLVSIYNFLLGAAALVAMLMLGWAGVLMLIYQWGEQPESDLANAKLTLRRAIFGLVIILTAYVVVNTLLGLLGLTDNAITKLFDSGTL